MSECVPDTYNQITIKRCTGFQTFVSGNGTFGLMPKWISIKDRLPEKGEKVLAIFVSEPNVMYNCYATGWFRDTMYTASLTENNDFMIESHGPTFDPTHWMTLPKPPNEET